MKITEKFYIDRLEKMIRKYKKNPCGHCPMQRFYRREKALLGQTLNETIEGVNHIHCQICRTLTAKYTSFTYEKYFLFGWCPCSFFRTEIFKLSDDEELPKGYMTKIAWQVIHGWRKDNKKKEQKE